MGLLMLVGWTFLLCISLREMRSSLEKIKLKIIKIFLKIQAILLMVEQMEVSIMLG
jgi:hypothetical protein